MSLSPRVAYGIDRLIDTPDRRSARRLEGSAKVYMTRGIPVNEDRTRIQLVYIAIYPRVREEPSASAPRFHVFSYTGSAAAGAAAVTELSHLRNYPFRSTIASIDYCHPIHPFGPDNCTGICASFSVPLFLGVVAQLPNAANADSNVSDIRGERESAWSSEIHIKMPEHA